MIIDYKNMTKKIGYLLLFAYVILVYMYGGNTKYTYTYKIPFVIFSIFQLIDMIKNKKILFPNNIKVLLIFNAFIVISSIWAIDSELSIGISKTIFQLILSYLIIYNFIVQDEDGWQNLIKILIFAGIFFSLYIISYYGIKNYFNFLNLGIRLGEEIDNVNRIGLETAITYTLVLYMTIVYDKKYFLLLPIPFIVAIGTASRKVVIILVMSTILILLFKVEKNKVKSVFKKVLLILLIIFSFAIVINFISDFSIYKRFMSLLNLFTGNGKVDNSTLGRALLIKYGFKEFLNHPIIGIGAHNSAFIAREAIGRPTYLHNNYVELLSTTGIIGFTLFYFNYYYLVKMAFSLSDSIENKNKRNFILILLSILLVLDYAVVSYSSMVTYLYFLIPLTATARNIKRKEKTK